MKNKANSADLLLWFLSVGLVVYTAFRSVHLVQATLPADAQTMGYFALFGLDVALFVWLWYGLHGARTSVQVAVSTAMIYIQILGITAAVLADTLMVFSGGTTSQTVYQVAAYLIPIVVGLNISAAVTCKFFSHDRSERLAGQTFDDELERQVSDLITANAPQYAQGVAPDVARARMATRIDHFVAGSKLQGAGGLVPPIPQNGTAKGAAYARDVLIPELDPDPAAPTSPKGKGRR